MSMIVDLTNSAEPTGAGLFPLSAGQIESDGIDISRYSGVDCLFLAVADGAPPDEVVRLGIEHNDESADPSAPWETVPLSSIVGDTSDRSMESALQAFHIGYTGNKRYIRATAELISGFQFTNIGIVFYGRLTSS